MQFSIVTPSFRNSRWLRLCIPSVADQGVEHEHIVQDSCSDDGTQDWLPRDRRVQAFIEKDRSMYDAVNRGLRRAAGDILAYINCDEQYLPGALGKVLAFFKTHPDVEAVFSHTVVVDDRGGYICDRTALSPQKYHTLLSGNLSFMTCATFCRRHLFERHNLYFNPDLRDIGDVDWTLRLLEKRVRVAVLPEFTSVFTETGANMSRGPNAAREKRELVARTPAWCRPLGPAFVAHFRLRRLLAGAYFTKPYQYSIYTEDSPTARRTFTVSKPTFRWVREPLPASG